MHRVYTLKYLKTGSAKHVNSDQIAVLQNKLKETQLSQSVKYRWPCQESEHQFGRYAVCNSMFLVISEDLQVQSWQLTFLLLWPTVPWSFCLDIFVLLWQSTLPCENQKPKSKMNWLNTNVTGVYKGAFPGFILLSYFKTLLSPLTEVKMSQFACHQYQALYIGSNTVVLDSNSIQNLQKTLRGQNNTSKHSIHIWCLEVRHRALWGCLP